MEHEQGGGEMKYDSQYGDADQSSELQGTVHDDAEYEEYRGSEGNELGAAEEQGTWYEHNQEMTGASGLDHFAQEDAAQGQGDWSETTPERAVSEEASNQGAWPTTALQSDAQAQADGGFPPCTAQHAGLKHEASYPAAHATTGSTMAREETPNDDIIDSSQARQAVPESAPLSQAAGAMGDTLEEDEGLGEDFDQTAWKPPCPSQAMKRAQYHMFEGGDAPLWSTGIADLKEWGLAVYLYFAFLKALSLTFAGLSVIHLPSMLLSAAGDAIPAEERDMLRFYALTVGNIGWKYGDEKLGLAGDDDALTRSGNESVTDTTNGMASLDYSRTYSVHLFGNAVGVGGVAACLSFCALVGALLLFYLWLWLKRTATEADAQVRADQVACTDYAVLVWNLPPNASKRDVTKHFTRLYAWQASESEARAQLSSPVEAKAWERINSTNKAAKKWLKKSKQANSQANWHPSRVAEREAYMKRQLLQRGSSLASIDVEKHLDAEATPVAGAGAPSVTETDEGVAASILEVEGILMPPPAVHVQMSPAVAAQQQVQGAELETVGQEQYQDEGEAPASPGGYDTASVVAEVVLIRDDREALLRFMKQRGRAMKLRRMRAQAKKYKSLSEVTQSSNDLEYGRNGGQVQQTLAQERLEDLRELNGEFNRWWMSRKAKTSYSRALRLAAQLHEVADKLDDRQALRQTDRPVLGAFVVFNSAFAARMCISDYATYGAKAGLFARFQGAPGADEQENRQDNGARSWIAELFFGRREDRWLRFEVGKKVGTPQAELEASGLDVDRPENGMQSDVSESSSSDEDDDPQSGDRQPDSVSVSPAPRPEDVIWENLPRSRQDRRLHRVFSLVACLPLLGLSFTANAYMRARQRRLANQLPDLSMCETELPAAFLGSYGNLSSLSKRHGGRPRLVRSDPALPMQGQWDEVCGNVMDDGVFMVYSATGDPLDPLSAYRLPFKGGVEANEDEVHLLSVSQTFSACRDPCPSSGTEDAGACPCVSPALQETCRTLRDEAYALPSLVACFCKQTLAENTEKYGMIQGFQQSTEDHYDVCFSTFSVYMSNLIANGVGVMVICAMNYLLKRTLYKLTRSEAHRSVEDRQHSFLLKTYIAQVISIAAIPLVVNGRPPTSQVAVAARSLYFMDGLYGDFEPGWFSDVGVRLASTVVVLCVVEIGPQLFASLVHRRAMRRDKRRREQGHATQAVMQKDLDRYNFFRVQNHSKDGRTFWLQMGSLAQLTQRVLLLPRRNLSKVLAWSPLVHEPLFGPSLFFL